MSPQYGISKWVWSIAFLLLLAGSSPGSGPNATPDELIVLAEAEARAGHPAQAAAAYEELLILEPSRRQAVAGILVKLHAEDGNS